MYSEWVPTVPVSYDWMWAQYFSPGSQKEGQMDDGYALIEYVFVDEEMQEKGQDPVVARGMVLLGEGEDEDKVHAMAVEREMNKLAGHNEKRKTYELDAVKLSDLLFFIKDFE